MGSFRHLCREKLGRAILSKLPGTPPAIGCRILIREQYAIRQYVKPILFGGDPSAKENMAWVSFEQHAELVRWWAKLYRDTVAKNG